MTQPLHISLNAARIEGPWGGGNRFVTYLDRYLTERGHRVVRDLRPGLDLILMIGVQPELRIVSYGPAEVADYLRTSPRTAAVLRVNNTDEAHGRDLGINRRFIAAATQVDHVVHCSRFSQELYRNLGIDPAVPASVILIGADESIFFPAPAETREVWTPGRPLRLITHHWSAGLLKGYDVYERIDAMLAEPSWSERFTLTYIGNRAVGQSLPRTRCLDPMEGPAIAQELRAHHVLITGARHEVGGNHHIEAMRCGLPVLYLESGATPEYCEPCGIGFKPHELEAKLTELPQRYPQLAAAVAHGPYPASEMARQYETLLQEVVARRRAEPREAAGPVERGRLWLRGRRRGVRRRLPTVKLKWEQRS